MSVTRSADLCRVLEVIKAISELAALTEAGKMRLFFLAVVNATAVDVVVYAGLVTGSPNLIV